MANGKVQCCARMIGELNRVCDAVREPHDNRLDCPDVILHQQSDDKVGIVVHDGGSSIIEIQHCPFCGRWL